MVKFNRIAFTFALSTIVACADSQSAVAQRIKFGGGSNNNNSNNNSDSNNNQGGNRRNRDRDDDDDDGIQQFQQLLQSGQGNSGNNQQFRRRGQQGQPFQGGQQILNSQQLQNFQQNNQGNSPQQNFRRRHNMQSWVVEFGGSTPFSAQWYNDHPQAFHHHHHDDDAWKVATAASVLTWLGWGAHHHQHDATIVYQPVPIETVIVDGQPVVVDPNAPGEWMTLGVYSLMTSPGDSGTRLVELAVDKHGNIRGNYYDTIANTSYNVTGRIHEPTQQVQWTLDTNKQLVFFTPLSQLTQSQGAVHVRFPSGQQQQWQLARMESANN